MLAVDALLHTNRRVAHFRLFVQARFDFTELDAVTANLHLMIDAADVFQHAVSAAPRQVTGAVQAFARRAERIRHKHRRGAQRIADVTATDTGAGNT